MATKQVIEALDSVDISILKMPPAGRSPYHKGDISRSKSK